MDNNENSVQETQNVQNQEKKQKKQKRGVPGALFIIMMIAVLIIGIGGGVLLTWHTDIFKRNDENKSTEQTNTSKKLDESKPWVYDMEIEENEFEYDGEKYKASENFKVPYININSDDAKKANEKILTVYNNAIQNFGTNPSDPMRTISGMQYNAYINGKYLSVVLTEHYGYIHGSGSTVGEYAYNFNLETLNFTTFKEVYEANGYSEKEVNDRISNLIEQAKKDVSSGPHANNSSIYFNNDFYIDEQGKINVMIANKHTEWGKTIVTYLTYKLDFITINQTTEKKVTNVTSGIINEDQLNSRQMVISGSTSTGEKVWEYTTLKENCPQETVNRSLKLIGTRNDKVYICDWGKLYILDEQTGKLLYSNTEVNMGGAAATTFDDKNNLYTASYLAPVYKFNENGQMVNETLDLWNSGFGWPTRMYLSSDQVLTIEYSDYESSVDVDTNTFLIKNVKATYDSVLNGEYSNSMGPVKIVALSESGIFYSFRLVKDNGNMGYVDGYAVKENDGTYTSRREENKLTFSFDGNTMTVAEEYDSSKYGLGSPECGGGVFLAGKYTK